MSMRKGSLNSVTQPLQGSRSMKGATPGMGADGDNAGVPTKQMEGVSVGNPKLTTPAKDKVDSGSKTASSMGAKVGKSANLITPASSVIRK
jgi:hypothetical protein